MQMITFKNWQFTKTPKKWFCSNSILNLSVWYILFLGLSLDSFPQKTIELQWLSNKNASKNNGVSWGVPFKMGEVSKDQNFILKDSLGNNLPIQSWNLAFWQDGSPKWVGFASTSNGNNSKLKLVANASKSINPPNGFIIENQSKFVINNGLISCIIPKSGEKLIDSLIINKQLVGLNGKLVGILQNTFESDVFESSPKEKFVSEIQKVILEQNGSVRSVIKIEGILTANGRKLLPFIIRFYFYVNSPEIKLVHTLIFDGDQHKDFIKGLGLTLDVPLREEILNRHVRFGGEDNGVWAEPIQPLTGRRILYHEGKNIYEKQILGLRVPNKLEYDTKSQYLVNDWAVWSDFRLIQNSADGFTIQKRTNPSSAWIDANAGKRASGIAYIGDVSGGLAVGVKNFWQSYPAAIELKNVASKTAELRAWLWSPYAEAMDMRHYDTLSRGHGLDASYEDVQPEFSTPLGVGRTSELSLFLYQNVPSNDILSYQINIDTQKPLLTCSPNYLHDAGAFGVWSLPDYSTKGKAWLENQLTNALDFYKKEVEQRHWYGFWNFGDFMHGYDPIRHSWKYDVGGYAWANTELAPDMWLWYSFLRTGRGDVFKMAEAMTRHTSEVDVYHIGRFAGLGSRHNVRHWGCGSKEVRISQAASKRFYYYLTTDERTGDLMREVVNADEAMTKLDPLRLILAKSQYPTHARIGPDWLALVGNWMTEWERTGDLKWKNKIIAGVNSFKSMPYGFFSGKDGAFGYDNETNKIYQLTPESIGNSHLATIMGGAEVSMELMQTLDNKDFNHLYLQYCQLYGASKDEVNKVFGREIQLGELSPHYARLVGYYANINKDENAAKKAWNLLLDINNKPWYHVFETQKVESPLVMKTIDEIPKVSTNNTAQWCLNAIEILELIGDKMPINHSNWDKK